jgi:hypothetical protein
MTKSVRYAITIVVLAATCSSGLVNAEIERPRTRAAPSPSLGTGALGIVVLAVGFLIAARRKL